MAKKDYARAILEFKNAAAVMPTDAESYYQLGMALAASGDAQGAYTSLRKAVALNPQHPLAPLRLAQLMASAQDPQVVKLGQEGLSKLPGATANPEILNGLALTQLKLGEVGDAVQNLQEALARSPKQLSSSIMLAMADLSKGDASAAERVLKQACASAPTSGAPHAALGDFYFGRHRIPEAEAEFERALQLDPKNAPVLFDLAMAQRSAGQMAQAEESFRRLASSGDKKYSAVHALFLFELGRRDEVVTELAKLAKEAPDDRLMRTRLIVAYESVHRLPDAERVLDEALKKDSHDMDALLQRAELLQAAGRDSEAERDLNEVLSLRPDSAEVHYAVSKLRAARGQTLQRRQELAEAVRLDPNFLAARLELAQLLNSNKDSAGALAVLDAAPDNPKNRLPLLTERNWVLWASGDMEEMRKGIDRGLAMAKSPDLLTQEGLWELRKGNKAAAQRALEEALKANPGDVLALEALYQAYSGPTGLEKVKEYASRQPKSAPMQELLGRVLLRNNDRDQARAAFEAAKAADPQFVTADLSLVQVDVLDKKFDDARNRLQAILASDSRNSMAYLWLGILDQATQNQPAALEELRKAVSADPQNAEALNNFAYLLSEYANKPDEALTYAQKACELDPGQPEYAETLGLILYRKGLYLSAIKQMESAASQKQNDAFIKYHLAMAYAKAGDAPRGRATLAAALKLNPRLPEARTAVSVVEAAK